MKTFKKIGLVTLGLIIGLIILELLFQGYYWAGEHFWLRLHPVKTTITWQENPILGPVLLTPKQQGWFVTPSQEYYSYIQSNSAGFYDYEHPLAKPANTYRILLLGDSFVASLQTSKNQTIAKQLEDQLNQSHLPQHIEVIAMGMGDTGTAQQYLALHSYGLKYQPDLVIAMFLSANDLKNNWPSLEKDPYRPYFKLDDQHQLVELPFQLKSKRRFDNLKSIIKQSRLVQLALAARQAYQERQANQKADYPLDYHVYDQNYTSDYAASWQVTQALIKQSQLESQQASSQYLLTVLANNEQVNQDVWSKLVQTYPKLKTAQLDLQKPEKMFDQFCQTQQLNCHLMLPDFLSYLKAHNYPKTHYTHDGHWNNLGTAIAAQSLTTFLLNNPQLLTHQDHFPKTSGMLPQPY